MARELASEEGGGHSVLRADARRNRQRILAAARSVFAEQGLAAPLEDIAGRAGVGIATLYRRFPTREELIVASFEREMDAYVDAADEALRAPDAWSGFRGYLERVCAMQAGDRGLQSLLTMSFPTAEAFEQQRTRAYQGFVEVIRRAKAEGTLRQDFVPEDLPLLMLANAGVVQGTREDAPDAWRRLVALFIDGCRTERSVPLPPPPTPDAMYRVLLRLAGSWRRSHA
jgi:AcrR family transcriptional regulator